MAKKKITEKKIIKEFEKLKKLSEIFFKLKLYGTSLEILSILSKLMYNFNLVYTDDQCENLLKKISEKTLNSIEKRERVKLKRIIFYDYFSLDNRGLTEQYLEALISLKYEILYISLNKDEKKMENILKMLRASKNVEIYIAKSRNKLKMIKEINEKARDFKASYLLSHTAPWDVVGNVVWINFRGELERFLINLTDHAFWLGKAATDYFIEFRDYGCNISNQFRKIKEEKIKLLPYYPVQNKENKFEGFEFKYENKKIIFSGGSLYKIYGSSKFFEIVKYILEEDRETIFLYLGNGNDTPLKKFIEKNNYEERFYYYTERKDIDEIFKKCYFYLGTYPICGGLMSQLAVANQKIPISYTEKSLQTNNIEELFINLKENQFTFNNLNDLKKEIKKLLSDKKYKEEKEKILKNIIITKEEFSKKLEDILLNQPKIQYKKYTVDIFEVSKIYFEQENNYLNKFNSIFLSRNIIVNLFFFKYSFSALREWFYKKIKNKLSIYN